ncbi:LuxR C-terminal-related transcriptional regulator [Pseudonocardia nematodicida]|uniref:LuxR C-terminal-related transcriptional regulator n=1 Tax=Pseudonocardia nematodicida TaxID=1206997 RepID=A0ABV1KDL7_9PSEU
MVVGHGAAERVRRRVADGPAVPFGDLTAREREVLDLVARGLTSTAIARRLSLSEKTVRNDVSAVFGKLRVGSRSAAVAQARDAGLGGPADSAPLRTVGGCSRSRRPSPRRRASRCRSPFHMGGSGVGAVLLFVTLPGCRAHRCVPHGRHLADPSATSQLLWLLRGRREFCEFGRGQPPNPTTSSISPSPSASVPQAAVP